MSAETSPLLLAYSEVARLLGVSERTVWSMVNQGDLPAVRLAKSVVRIHRHDLDQFIETSKNREAML